MGTSRWCVLPTCSWLPMTFSIFLVGLKKQSFLMPIFHWSMQILGLCSGSILVICPQLPLAGRLPCPIIYSLLVVHLPGFQVLPSSAYYTARSFSRDVLSTHMLIALPYSGCLKLLCTPALNVFSKWFVLLHFMLQFFLMLPGEIC